MYVEAIFQIWFLFETLSYTTNIQWQKWINFDFILKLSLLFLYMFYLHRILLLLFIWNRKWNKRKNLERFSRALVFNSLSRITNGSFLRNITSHTQTWHIGDSNEFQQTNFWKKLLVDSLVGWTMSVYREKSSVKTKSGQILKTVSNRFFLSKPNTHPWFISHDKLMWLRGNPNSIFFTSV